MKNGCYKINLPQQAIDYYNQKADELLLKLEPLKKSSFSDEATSSTSHFYSHTIHTKEIKNLNVATVDGFGNIRSNYFNTSSGPVGLCGENYENCRIIVEELSRKKGLRNTVSYEFIHASIFKWFSEKYNGHIKQDLQFFTYLSSKIPEVIDEYNVAIPISFLTIEKPFKIGNIIFDFLKTDLFDKYEKSGLAEIKDENKAAIIKQGVIKIRKKYQGKVCAKITIKAEKNRAIEIAKAETDNSLAVLQFFSPAALFPEITNYIGRMGQLTIPKSNMFIFKGGSPEIIESTDDNKYPYWHIGNKELSKLEELGVKIFSDLIIKEKLSQLEKSCLTSIRYYTKAISLIGYHDRLVFLLVSIETLLLRDTKEKIQQNVGRRLAVLTGTKNKSLCNVISLIDKAYHHRSSYLHHGKTISNIDTLRNLQLKIWDAIRITTNLTLKFNTKNELIDYIDAHLSSNY